MSVEASKTTEETPVVDAAQAVPEQTETPAAPAEVPAAETTEAAAPAAEEPKSEAVEVVPASEGVLGYKGPGFLKGFTYSKHFFWFSDEPSTAESLATYVRSDKHETATHAAWARETGKGLLFYAKRAEDKATPTGLILLSEASTVFKEGFTQFSFKVGRHQYRFEAASSGERDSWVVAVEKKIEEAKGLKEEITGKESYKKNLDEYTKTTPAVATTKPKEPKKSLDATTATATAAAATVTAPVAEDVSALTPAAETKTEKKERSQSRKRSSIFGIGTLLGKKEEKEEVKKEEPKEEAKTTEEPSEAAKVTEPAADVDAPAAESKPEEKDESAAPGEKKAKRSSVFGSLFGKKGFTLPGTEKSEKEAAPAKESEVPPVSETAPKIEEPIENKPIDAAAVTGPADTTETAAPAEEPVTEPTPAPATTEAATAPHSEKKGGLISFIKKAEARLEGKKEHKEEAKEDKPAETTKEPAAAAPASSEPAATESTENGIKEERPAREKRRTSLFGSLGTIRKKSPGAAETEEAAEPKREKSPLPAKLGGLFRRPSKAVKSEAPKETTPAESAPATTEAASTETPATDATPATAAPETTEKTVGEAVPDEPHTSVPEAVPAVPVVQASA